MSKYDDFWNDIAPVEKKEGESQGTNTNINADLETALAKANTEIDKLKKMISELKPAEEPKKEEPKKEEENKENE